MPSKSDKQNTMVTEESYEHTCSRQHGSKNQLCINLLVHLVISAILLVLSGDIEINPGPPTSSVNSSNASSFDDSCTLKSKSKITGVDNI